MFFFSLFGSGLDISSVLILVLSVLLSAMIAIVFHEVAHGFVAMKFGDYTAKARGRLTLNPVVHFDFLGLFMLLLVGFGWAKPVPIDPNNFSDYKKGMISVSLAGVVTNVILGFTFLLLLYLLAPIFAITTANRLVFVLQQFLFYFLFYSILINFILAFFNMLPIYPLDGFRLLNLFLKPGNSFSVFMYKNGFYVLLGVIIGGRLMSSFGFPFLNIFSLVSNGILSMINFVLNAAGIGI